MYVIFFNLYLIQRIIEQIDRSINNNLNNEVKILD